MTTQTVTAGGWQDWICCTWQSHSQIRLLLHPDLSQLAFFYSLNSHKSHQTQFCWTNWNYKQAVVSNTVLSNVPDCEKLTVSHVSDPDWTPTAPVESCWWYGAVRKKCDFPIWDQYKWTQSNIFFFFLKKGSRQNRTGKEPHWFIILEAGSCSSQAKLIGI